VNIWQTYNQERGCLMHISRLANTLLKDEESARDNHVFAFNFAKYSPILIFFHFQFYREAVNRAPPVERAAVERRVSAAPVSRAPQLTITNYLG